LLLAQPYLREHLRVGSCACDPTWARYVLEIRSADQSLRLAAADAAQRDAWMQAVRALVGRMQRAARRSKQALTGFVARFPAGRVPVRLADGAEVEVRSARLH
jgi:hypothetical protein